MRATSYGDQLTSLSGHEYQRTLPEDLDNISEIEMKDVIFRVLADHARCLSCSIADGILPGNEGRNYVLRRILRRAVMYGRRLGLENGFFAQLVPTVVKQLGQVFPELEKQQGIIQKIIQSEEDSFSRTLDRGIQLFENTLAKDGNISGEEAFRLFDTFGFPIDLTQLLAKQKGIYVDTEAFNVEMEKQRDRARASQKKTDILVADSDGDTEATTFLGFDTLADEAELIDIVKAEDSSYLVFNHTPFYAEMGGQVGDTGAIEFDGAHFDVIDTIKDDHGRFLHKISGDLASISSGIEANLIVDRDRRRSIERHHSATHVLHWALRKVLGTHVRQAGSYVDSERLRFDFAHFEAIKPEELAEIEKLCNEHLLDNSIVRWFETPFDQKPNDVIAFFGEKYGDVVRVVDIGGFSKELCGGTHVRATGEIGLIKISSESAIAAGTRRIEAIVGNSLYSHINEIEQLIATASQSLSTAPADLLKKIDSLLTRNSELEKQLKKFQQKASGNLANDLVKTATESDGLKIVRAEVQASDPNALRQLGASVLGKLGEGIVVLGAKVKGKASVVAFCSKGAIGTGHKAGDIVRELTIKLDGKGGGKPDFAMGGGTNVTKLEEVINSFQR